MAARKFNRQLYDDMVAAFQAMPGNIAHAARACGVSVPTARKGWNEGWSAHLWAKPIKLVVHEDQQAARTERHEFDTLTAGVAAVSLNAALEAANAEWAKAKAARENLDAKASQVEIVLAQANEKAKEIEAHALQKAQEALAKAEVEGKARLAKLMEGAKVDALETLAQEAQGVGFGRRNALLTNSYVFGLLQHGRLLQKKFDECVGDPAWDPSPAQILTLSEKLARIGDLGVRMMELALKNERLRVGDPTEIVSIRDENVSLEEEERLLGSYQRALERKKLRLLNGGGENPESDEPPEVMLVSSGSGDSTPN